jgi:hypothetical protein
MNTANIRDRNQKIISYYLSDPKVNITEIAAIFGLKKQRVSKILKRYLAVRNCQNCYHFQEFKHCSCRIASDVVTTNNKCQDWQPIERS